MCLDVGRRAFRIYCKVEMLQRTGDGFLHSISGSRSFCLDAGIQRVQDMARVEFHIIETFMTSHDKLSMSGCDSCVCDGDDQKSDIGGRVSPICHDGTEMQVGWDRFAFCGAA